MARETLELEPTRETSMIFREIQRLLGHDEPEETFAKLVELGYAAMSLTSRENTVISLYTYNPDRASNAVVTCPHCSREHIPNVRRNDFGFRETQVRLK